MNRLASPNYAYQIYNATNAANPTGSEELRDMYIDIYKKLGVNYTFIPFDGRYVKLYGNEAERHLLKMDLDLTMTVLFVLVYLREALLLVLKV